MSDWFHSLPISWMALIVFGFTYFVVALIYVVVGILAVGERARAFKSVSPGMLPPLGIIFGLFVGFTAAQVWSDSATATAAVDREASALRSAALLAVAFPGEPKNAGCSNKELHCRCKGTGMATNGQSRHHAHKGAAYPFSSPAIHVELAARWLGPTDCPTRDHKRFAKCNGCSPSTPYDQPIAGYRNKVVLFIFTSDMRADSDCACP